MREFNSYIGTWVSRRLAFNLHSYINPISLSEQMIFGNGCLDPRAIISCYPVEAVTIDINIALFYNIKRIHVKAVNKASYSQEEFRIGKTIV